MGKVLWRIINIFSILLSIFGLLLQIVAIAVGSWKETDVAFGQYEPVLYNIYMHRHTGLLSSHVSVERIDANDDIVVDIPNKFIISKGDHLRACADGPSVRRLLSVCGTESYLSDCRCSHLPLWTALAVLEFLALPLSALLVVCCFLLRTYSQTFLKTITLALSVLTSLVLMIGFILVFQHWNVDIALLMNIFPFLVRNIALHYLPISHETVYQFSGLPHIGKEQTRFPQNEDIYNSISIYPSWSAFLSLGAFIAISALVCFLVLSWIIDRQHSKKERRLDLPGESPGRGASYRPIRS